MLSKFEKQMLIRKATNIAIRISIENGCVIFSDVIKFLENNNLTPNGIFPARFAAMITEVADGNTGFAEPEGF